MRKKEKRKKKERKKTNGREREREREREIKGKIVRETYLFENETPPCPGYDLHINDSNTYVKILV